MSPTSDGSGETDMVRGARLDACGEVLRSIDDVRYVSKVEVRGCSCEEERIVDSRKLYFAPLSL